MKAKARLGAAKATIKTKRVKASKAAQMLADIKHMGEEPFQKGESPTDLQYMQALNWYNVMCTKVEAREYLELYLKSKSRASEIKTLRKVPDSRVPDHAAWIARMVSRGVNLTSRSVNKMESLLKECYLHVEQPKIEVKKQNTTPKPTIQERVRDKVSDFISEFEELIDKQGWTASMYDELQKKQLPPNLAKQVADFYAPIADEASELVSKQCDPKLKEGYSSYTQTQLKQRAQFYTQVVSDCQRHGTNTKKQRSVRKKKVPTVEKRLKHFKYQKESKEFRIVSINPEKLFGAEELVVFNTKTKILTHFVALDRGGLNVNRTSITNLDETKSKSYRIGRKAVENVEIVLRGGKRAYSKMLDSLTPSTLQQRINENTILLRI